MPVRFWAKVVESEGCWLWAGRDVAHHATIALDDGTHRSIGAHVFSYILHYGPIPRGMVVRHKCDHHACVRPDHLELGTRAENVNDAVMRGRVAYGERQGHAKLSESQVMEIREKYATGGFTQKELALAYGACRASICQIVNGKYWQRAAGPTKSARPMKGHNRTSQVGES